MNPKWAEENLQTIRTLMERSATYRRALAPIMIFVGVMGIVGGLAGWAFKIEKDHGFVWLWIGVAIVAFSGTMLMVRKQALKDSEPFWSPPTQRVAQALKPGFFIGLMLAVFALMGRDYGDPGTQCALVAVWALCYGCAMHAAGFFMPRGVRWASWIFIFVGFLTLVLLELKHCWLDDSMSSVMPHLFMAAIFGGLHLAYGIYLYFTEKKSPHA